MNKKYLLILILLFTIAATPVKNDAYYKHLYTTYAKLGFMLVVEIVLIVNTFIQYRRYKVKKDQRQLIYFAISIFLVFLWLLISYLWILGCFSGIKYLFSRYDTGPFGPNDTIPDHLLNPT